MTTRAEHQLAIIVAERLVVHRSSNSVGTGFLLGERYIIFHTVFLSVFSYFGFHQFGKKVTVFGRNREMYVHLARLSCGIKCTFYQVFFQRSAHTVGIPVEFEQTFRKRTVIQSCAFQQVAYHSLIILFFQKSIDVFTRVVHTRRVQVVIESETMDVVEKLLLEIGSRHVVVGS